MIDGRLFQDAAQMKPDVLPAMHLIGEPWRLITPTTIKNCFGKCGFLINHVRSNDNSTVKLTEDEQDGWRSLHSLGVQSETTHTSDSGLKVCGV
jgi:hypothetical protein